jgi:hypothetical protein
VIAGRRHAPSAVLKYYNALVGRSLHPAFHKLSIGPSIIHDPCYLRKQLYQNNNLLHLLLHEYFTYLEDKYQFNETTRRRVERWGSRQLSDLLSETLSNCLFRRRPKKTYLDMMTSNRLDAWAGVEVRSRCPQIRDQLLLSTAQEL